MDGWRAVLAAYLGSWPHHNHGEEALAAYVHELEVRGIRPDEALRALRSSTGQFPPSAGALAAVVQRERQGPPPGYLAAHAALARNITLLPYADPESGMPALIERLASEGHEAVARWAVEMSPQELRELPDPAYPQDREGAWALGRAERGYNSAVEGWRADPTPGLAGRLVGQPRGLRRLDTLGVLELEGPDGGRP